MFKLFDILKNEFQPSVVLKYSYESISTDIRKKISNVLIKYGVGLIL